MNKVVRCGDFSSRSTLCMEVKSPGIIIRCGVDPKKFFEAPNPKFCGAYAGGGSLATYNVLWHLYKELPTDQNQHAFISSERNDGSKFIIIFKDDIIVGTNDTDGKFGVNVFVGKKSPYFIRLMTLFHAIESDNEKVPLLNALKPSP